LAELEFHRRRCSPCSGRLRAYHLRLPGPAATSALARQQRRGWAALTIPGRATPWRRWVRAPRPSPTSATRLTGPRPDDLAAGRLSRTCFARTEKKRGVGKE
jgi:hypothetical protein